ncbi:hypothetical protein GCM10027277_03950 [Pseudoduganella ginsengisoli]|uniref:Phasin domain-containing protein n=1 Tax=Pseudoduganella ginsengisoli TaxID=1462440 RepID=A0A6L6Q567_9BURK|nr:hypothetical protein [Pseudoduganella ginsengisoli]MTW04830.1 hypothetical protein [Pseudoduganella ginsengisoli]
MSDFVQPPPSAAAYPGAGEVDNMWRKLSSLYGEVFQHGWQEWLTTSTQIIQQQAVRAMLDTSQALFESAAKLQQKAWGQLWSANQQATAIVADGMARTATEAVNQVTAQATQAVEAATRRTVSAADANADAARQ